MPKQEPNSFWPSMRDNALFATVLLVVLILLGGLFASLTVKSLIEIEQVGMAQPSERSITVEGSSSVTAVPDLATISIGVETTADSVESAQNENSAAMDTIIAQIKELGISDEDIQTTSYNVYEDEVYSPDTGEFISLGWIVYQFVEVKVRNIELAPQVLAIAGREGATDIYGPNFSVDDTSNQKQTARIRAIAEARQRAEEIANALGVNIGDVIDYDEWSDDYYPQPYYAETSAFGLGGVEDAALEPGSEDVSLNVVITFELVQ